MRLEGAVLARDTCLSAHGAQESPGLETPPDGLGSILFALKWSIYPLYHDSLIIMERCIS